MLAPQYLPHVRPGVVLAPLKWWMLQWSEVGLAGYEDGGEHQCDGGRSRVNWCT